MRRCSLKTPLWQKNVTQTINKIKKSSKSRFLKSINIYDCICIFIYNHFNKNIFAYSTIHTYYINLNIFNKWLNNELNILNINLIKTNHLHSYFKYLINIKKYKNTSLESVYIALMRFFRSMKHRRILNKNPFQNFFIKSHRYMKNEKILNIIEVKKLLQSVGEHYEYLKTKNRLNKFSLFIHRRDICIITLAIACGIRRNEIQKIEIQNINFDATSILIKGKGSKLFNIKERKIFFSHPFLEIIISKYYDLRKKLPGNSFFSNCYGDTLTKNAIGQIFRRYSKYAFNTFIANTTNLRKSFTSYLVKKKIPIKAIQIMLGHENCEVTLKYYVHHSVDDLKITWKETTPYDK
jgi:integrase/recombinase XerC